jgi:hypothetical protein
LFRNAKKTVQRSFIVPDIKRTTGGFELAQHGLTPKRMGLRSGANLEIDKSELGNRYSARPITQDQNKRKF